MQLGKSYAGYNNYRQFYSAFIQNAQVQQSPARNSSGRLRSVCFELGGMGEFAAWIARNLPCKMVFSLLMAKQALHSSVESTAARFCEDTIG
ncbi:MAG: hypothetical protein AB4050_17465 [Synechococcus sp.]